MHSQDTDRIKAAMVIYALEQDLGEYVRTEHTELQKDGTANSIAARIQQNSTELASPTRHQIVEATFLTEVLNLSIAASAKTADSEHFIRLRTIFEALEIPDIRNAVSHPNRPFIEAYWHRTAALATDPVIDRIGFTRVIQRYRLACEGRITPPPDEWMELRRSYIRNNLPDTVEHEVTGLIGRDKDLTKLEGELKSGRNGLVALVARGGIGKTSLALECLNRLVLKPETADWAEAVIYCTMKQEQLTANGIQKIDSPNTITSLKDALLSALNFVLLDEAKTLDAFISTHQESKLLIAIDNLETLLRDTPDQFTNMIDELPRDWKILVTSRLPVDSAKNFPVDSLSRPSSLFLTRKYFQSRGYPTISAETLERIGRASNDNPLAIRLIADLYLAGKDVDSAISVAANEITNFSFSNLIDALTDDAIFVLEGLFALGLANRRVLVETLEISLDRVAAAIGQLAKTSLISRATDEHLEEVYSIDESIRDLLRVSPKNLDIRRRVNSNISRLRANKSDILLQQRMLHKNIFDRDYIQEDCPSPLVPLIDRLNGAIAGKNAQIVRELDVKLRSIEEIYRKSTAYYKQLVRIAHFFGDQVAEEAASIQMLQIDPADPYALLSLGYLYQSQQKLPDALKQFQLLFDHGWGSAEKSGQIAAVSIHQGYVTTLVFMGEFEKVLDLTKDWRTKGNQRVVYGVGRASAFRHLAESGASSLSRAEARIAMASAVTVLAELYALEGYPKPILKEQLKVIQNIPTVLVGIENTAQDRQTTLRLIKYCFDHIPLLTQHLQSEAEVIAGKLSHVEVAGNPFAREAAAKSHTEDVVDAPNISEELQVVEIYHIPSSISFPKYMFAKDQLGNAYFLQSEKFQKGDWANWILLKVGSKVAVQAVPSTTGSTDFRATKIIAL